MRRPRPGGCAGSCPALKKAAACRGVVMYEDEASFWLDGTLHQTWARVGVQPRIDTFGMRKTAHIFGTLSLEGAAAVLLSVRRRVQCPDIPRVPETAGAPVAAERVPRDRQQSVPQPRRCWQSLARGQPPTY